MLFRTKMHVDKGTLKIQRRQLKKFLGAKFLVRGLSAVTPSINVTGGGGLNQVFIEPIEMKKSEAFYGIKRTMKQTISLMLSFLLSFSPPPRYDSLCVPWGGGGFTAHC